MENNIIKLLEQLTSRDLIDTLDDPIFLNIKKNHPIEWDKLKMAYYSELERMRNIYMDAYCAAINENNTMKTTYEEKIKKIELEKETIKQTLNTIEKECTELRVRLEYNSSNTNNKSQIIKYLFIGIGSLMCLGFIFAITDKEAYKTMAEGLGHILRSAKDVVVESHKIK